MFHWPPKLFSRDTRKNGGRPHSPNGRNGSTNRRRRNSNEASRSSQSLHARQSPPSGGGMERHLVHDESTEADVVTNGSQSNNFEAPLEAGVGGSSNWASRSPSPSYPVSRSQSNLDQLVRRPLPHPPPSSFRGGEGGGDGGGDGFRSPMHAQSDQSGSQPLPEPSPGGTEAECATPGYPTDSFSSESSIESMEPRDGELRSPHRRFSEGDFREMHAPQRGSTAEFLLPGSPLPTPTSQRTNHTTRSTEMVGARGVYNHNYVNGAPPGSNSNSAFSSPVLSPRALAPASSHSSGVNDTHLSVSEKPGAERSPLHSPKISPLPSRAVSPRHSRAGGASYELASVWPDDPRQAHPLPLPPPPQAAPVPVSPRTATPPRSPTRAEPVVSTGKWIKGKLLGRGSFGSVYRGMHSETGDMCAIKEVQIINDDHKSKESALQLQQEINMLSNLRHPNIVHYKGSEMVGDLLNIYLELVSEGSLYKLIQEYKALEEPVIRRYTRQILMGLKCLHENSIVHRDIKSANILIDQDGRVKVADFGVAKHIKEEATPLSFKGSPYWMAPEVIMQRVAVGYELAVDIWSLGCTVIEMATGKPPWSEYEGVAAMFKVTRSDAAPIPESLSAEGKDFVAQCLQRNPEERPTAVELLDHPFVQIPSDCPDLANQATNAVSALGLGERGIVRERTAHESGSSSPSPYGRAIPHQLFQRETHHSTRASRAVMEISSLSAPVSPRSSRQSYRLLPMRSTPVKSGFRTPPTGGGQGAIPYYAAYDELMPMVNASVSSTTTPRRSNNRRGSSGIAHRHSRPVPLQVAPSLGMTTPPHDRIPGLSNFVGPSPTESYGSSRRDLWLAEKS